MPVKNKRKAGDFDPTKSDSDDSTYGASVQRNSRGKPVRSQRSKPSRKRQRREYGDDDSEEISEDSDIGEAFFQNEDADDVEIDERTGRPKRKAAKNRRAYQEEDTEDSAEEALDSAPENDATLSSKKRKQTLIVKLRTPQFKERKSRKRTASVSEVHTTNKRRSSRIAHDESEPILALTDSGHHADVLRPGTRTPEPVYQRARRGGKGLKTVPQSFDAEEEGEPVSAGNASAHGEALYNVEIAASNEDLAEKGGDQGRSMQEDSQPASAEGSMAIPESDHELPIDEVDEDDDEDPIAQPTRRSTRQVAEDIGEASKNARGLRSRNSRSQRGSQRNANQESSDFEPVLDDGEEDDVSDSQASSGLPQKDDQAQDEEESPGLRSSRRRNLSSRGRRSAASEERDSEVADELAEELQELQSGRPRRHRAQAQIVFDDKPRRTRKPVDYRILRPDLVPPIEEDDDPVATPSRVGRGRSGGVWQRTLYSTYGPFGGADGPTPLFGGPGGIGAAGNADSDSSDDEGQQRSRPQVVGGTAGMTPTSANPAFGLFPSAVAHNTDPQQALAGTPANLGRIKDKQHMADADPLGVDQNVNFDGVGGLQGHIDQLKEMVTLPLLYPELFKKFHVTPPRGVLFHGPPGTGKTLLARALASSVSSQGRKVTFYMRKGADALSKWVGEAERQLRLLFEEARKTQPSIIFFDEIDGLAPVRSSKQEQIHASIVSTLLALMDGMDGRGQVVVIGATNRPDSVDPALRRPGRFDREFYFPLPNGDARRAIIDIHTKSWDPPLSSDFKDEIAAQTKGYGGADLRALCTEAALNAVQRRYPQIYKSNEKLKIEPDSIKVTAKDFMISIRRVVPSSERSTSSGAAALPASVEPLLRGPLQQIRQLISEILPQRKPLTALEEAEFEDANDDQGMKTERMQQEFDRSRIFRPRLLLNGPQGMGQQYLAAALLNHFEGLHVQSFDLPTLLSDATRTTEAAIVQMFLEVKRHKPSVIYIPNVDIWYRTIGDAARTTFSGLLRSLSPTDPVLLLGVIEVDEDKLDEDMIKSLFGFSRRNRFFLDRPDKIARAHFFQPILEYLRCSPTDFPEPANRKKRELMQLEIAPPVAPRIEAPTKAELRLQKKRDRLTLNQLKILIQKTMDQIRRAYKKFRHGIIDESQIQYLFDEADPSVVTSDAPQQFRPYEKAKDKHGEDGLRDVATGKFYYNLEIITIERRLANGYYMGPQDFTADIKKLWKDAKTLGDQDRMVKAEELFNNVETDMDMIESNEPVLMSQLNGVRERERQRMKEREEKVKQLAEGEDRRLRMLPPSAPLADQDLEGDSSSRAPLLLEHPATTHKQDDQTSPSDPSQLSSLTNGISVGLSDLSNLGGHQNSNGTSVPSRDNDRQLSTSQSIQQFESGDQQSSFGQSAQTRPQSQFTGAQLTTDQRRGVPGSLSQKSGMTPMAPDTSAHDYTNYASTTSSEKKNTGSSGPFTQNTLTQSSHDRGEGPDLSMIPDGASTNSQLPDTQSKPSSSQQSFNNLMAPILDSQLTSKASRPSSQSNPSQNTPTVSGSHKPTIGAMLNDDEPAPSQRQLTRFQIDNRDTEAFIDETVLRTSGYSVEQLEQVYSAIMDKIWRTRSEWDRREVVEACRMVVNESLADMQECQLFLPGSMDSDHY